jgi:DNA-binding protein HU-beta
MSKRAVTKVVRRVVGMRDLVNELARRTGVTKQNVTAVMREFQRTVLHHVLIGNTVAFKGFGDFHTRVRAERIGRNPASGESVVIPSIRRLHFGWSKSLTRNPIIRDVLRVVDEDALRSAAGIEVPSADKARETSPRDVGIMNAEDIATSISEQLDLI